jgi:hypothetical protein
MKECEMTSPSLQPDQKYRDEPAWLCTLSVASVWTEPGRNPNVCETV